MSICINKEYLDNKRCIFCGDTAKSYDKIMVGQIHVATIMTCCNCGLTLTFSHNAREYAKYMMTGDIKVSTEEICDQQTGCRYKTNCPRMRYNRRI